MSKILRRPMFRGGGQVSSYGNGITTGLANGGMPAKRGLVNGPGGYAGGPFKTGAEVKRDAPGIFGFKFNKPLLSIPTPKNRVGAVNFDLGDFGLSPSDLTNALSEGSPYREYVTSDKEEFETEITEDGDVKFKLDENGDRIPIKSDKGSLEELINTQRIEDITNRDTQGELGDKVTGMEEVYGTNILDERNKKINGLALGKIDTSLTNNNSVLENQNKVTDDAELSLDEIKDALGSKKAFGRDASDMLLGFAGAEGDTVSEKFKSFAAAEAKKGPSRTEQIDQAAATFMLKDKFQTKRDKAKVNLMRADVDYKIAAGKELNISESIYEATKNGASTDRKIAIGIQRATSPTTGERYKFKGIIDATNLEAVLDSKKLKTGDTLLVKTTTRDKKTGTDKTIKKIIEIQEDGTAKEIFNL